MFYKTCLSVVAFVGTREKDNVIIDDFAFQLQYRVTTAIALLASILISTSEFAGENIACHANTIISDEDGDMGENPGTYVQMFCWITGLYITPESYGASSEYDGYIADYNGSKCTYREDKNRGWVLERDENEPCIKTLGYYQWIPFVLFLQGCIFYLPRLFWKVMEEGKLDAILSGFEDLNFKRITQHKGFSKTKHQLGNKSEGDEGKKQDPAKSLAKNVVHYIKMKEAGHLRYGIAFIVSQVILVFNVLIVFWMNNSLLDGDFLWLGPKWAAAPAGTVDVNSGSSWKNFNGENMNKGEVLYRTFPRRAECKVNWRGTSGGLETTNFYCILPMNAVSQYIFLILWFWYTIILIINFLNLIRVVLMSLKIGTLRSLYLTTAVFSRKFTKELESDNGALTKAIKNLNFGQFLFLHFVARNTGTHLVKCILRKLKEGDAPNKSKAKLEGDSSPPSYNSSAVDITQLVKEHPGLLELEHAHTYCGSYNVPKRRNVSFAWE